MQYDITIKKLPKSEVEMSVSLSAEVLQAARPKAIKKLGETIEIDGFRKGNIPEKVLLERIGERALLEEMAEIALGEHYPKILEQTQLDTIGRPTISLTKLAAGNALEFTVRTAVMPQFELPDYKVIAKKEKGDLKVETPEATDKEIDDVILQIRKNKAHFDWHKANPEADHHNHPDLEKEESLPAFDDEFAKSAGNFQNIEELKEKIKENIIDEKKNKNREKERAAILDAILAKTELDIPNILIESEIDKSVAQMKDDVARMGGKFDDYLTHTKKTEDDIRNDVREASEKKAKLQLIFNKIAETEKLEPNKEILENEVKTILEHYPDAKPDNVRVFVLTQLLNQEVLKLLEKA